MDIRTLLGSLVGSATQNVRTSSPVADHYARYLGALLERALSSWAAVHSSGVKCWLELHGRRGERVRCGGPAIGACMVCGGPVCVGHALVSPTHVMCLGCAHMASETLQGPPLKQDGEPFVVERPPWDRSPAEEAEREQHAEKRRTALRLLGLSESASEEQIREAYRRLAREHHPDRQRSATARDRAEKRMRELNEAYTFLTERRAA